MSAPLHGSCYCNAIEFTVAAEPSGGVLCHCVTCQKLHSHNSYNLQAKFDDIKVLKGTTKVYVDTKADSGKSISRHFCGDCGSALYSVPDSMPGVAFIKVGALDNAKDIKPVAEIYADTAMPHSILDAKHGHKRFEGMMAKEVPTH